MRAPPDIACEAMQHAWGWECMHPTTLGTPTHAPPHQHVPEGRRPLPPPTPPCMHRREQRRGAGQRRRHQAALRALRGCRQLPARRQPPSRRALRGAAASRARGAPRGSSAPCAMRPQTRYSTAQGTGRSPRPPRAAEAPHASTILLSYHLCLQWDARLCARRCTVRSPVTAQHAQQATNTIAAAQYNARLPPTNAAPSASTHYVHDSHQYAPTCLHLLHDRGPGLLSRSCRSAAVRPCHALVQRSVVLLTSKCVYVDRCHQRVCLPQSHKRAPTPQLPANGDGLSRSVRRPRTTWATIPRKPWHHKAAVPFTITHTPSGVTFASGAVTLRGVAALVCESQWRPGHEGPRPAAAPSLAGLKTCVCALGGC